MCAYAHHGRLVEAVPEALVSTCTECGASVGHTAVCPQCRHPKWYTLKKVAICFIVVVVLVVITKSFVLVGDRTLAQWFGSP